MRTDIPDIVKDNCFNSLCYLNDAERNVIIMGDEAYRESLDLENDDAECWKVLSEETYGFVGWNPQCIPSIEYIKWKLENIHGL